MGKMEARLWQVSQTLKRDNFWADLARPIDQALEELAQADASSEPDSARKHRKQAQGLLGEAHDVFRRAAERGIFVEEERVVSAALDALERTGSLATHSPAALEAEASALMEALQRTAGQRQHHRQASATAQAEKFRQQALSACAGALITSVLVTPFEVVKVRQQAMIEQPPAAITLARKLVRTEGLRTLWSGLGAALVMGVPSTVFYLTAYESTRDELNARWAMGHQWASFVAGGAARLITSTMVSPLELLRTRMQAHAEPAGLFALAREAVRSEGVSSLWRGLVPTLWRDVPFSCFYWLTYEMIKHRCLATSSNQELPASLAFGAGATAGTLAAVATTPLDVIKTRQQLQENAERCRSSRACGGTAYELVKTARAEGLSALFVGLGPRVAKVAPSCAIMIASYELGKRYLSSPPAQSTRQLASAPPARQSCLGSYISSCNSNR